MYLPADGRHPVRQDRTDKLKGKKGYYEYVIWAKDNGRFSW